MAATRPIQELPRPRAEPGLGVVNGRSSIGRDSSSGGYGGSMCGGFGVGIGASIILRYEYNEACVTEFRRVIPQGPPLLSRFM